MNANRIHIDSKLVNDLSLVNLFARFTKMNDLKSVHEWIITHICHNASVIKFRNDAILLLLNHPVENDLLLNQVKILNTVQDIITRHRILNNNIINISIHIKLLRMFIKALNELLLLMNKNDIFNILVKPIKDLININKINEMQGLLNNIDALYISLNNTDIVVGIDPNAVPTKFALMSFNQSLESDKGLFNENSNRQPMLFDIVPAKERRNIGQLEVFIQNAFERKHKKMIQKINILLQSFPHEALEKWMNWVHELDPILIGCSYANVFKNKNITLCSVMCNEEGMTISKLVSPELVINTNISPVPFNMNNKNNTINLITGANHSGKTTCIKSIAQCLIFAQLGFPVPAEAFSFKPFHKFFTLFSAGEVSEVSRFENEVKETHLIMSKVDSNSIIFFNEPYTSTNPNNAIELLDKIIMEICVKNTTIFVVTHLYEIYKILLKKLGIQLNSYVARTSIDNNNINYDYIIEQRPPDMLSHMHAIAKDFGIETSKYINCVNDINSIQCILDSYIEDMNRLGE